MNEELASTLNQLLKSSISAIDKGVSWLDGQLPELISQFIVWSLVSSGFWLLLGFGLLGIGFWFLKIGNKICKANKEKESYRRSDSDVPCFFAAAIFGVVGIVMSLTAAYSILFMLIAPKVFLLEQFIRYIPK
jgi:hypothetical protein